LVVSDGVVDETGLSNTGSDDSSWSVVGNMVNAETTEYTLTESDVREITTCSITCKGRVRRPTAPGLFQASIKCRVDWFNGSWQLGTLSSVKSSSDTEVNFSVSGAPSGSDITKIRAYARVTNYGSGYAAGAASNWAWIEVTLNSYEGATDGFDEIATGTVTYMAVR
jgi:hypothetical protein